LTGTELAPVEAFAREHYSDALDCGESKSDIRADWGQSRNHMKYNQLDRIIELVPGERLVAERTLRAEEEYLAQTISRNSR